MSNPEEDMKRRASEEIGEAASGGHDVGKKQKLENDDVGNEAVVVRLGTKEFTSSRQMFETVRSWLRFYSVQPLISNHDCDAMLLDLVKKGHPDSDTLIGSGVASFKVRQKYMCSDLLTFMVVREDDSKEEFCYRSCVNNILPLPEDLKDQGSGVVAVCGCHVEGGMRGLHRRRSAELSEIYKRLKQDREAKLDEEAVKLVSLGPKKFRSCHQMYWFFFDLLIRLPLNEALVEENAHEMLHDLLKKGDPESGKKIGSSSGVESFQVRIHPGYGGNLRSFYFVRGDGSMEDFCFIKCVDGIFPIAEKAKRLYVGPCSCHHEQDSEGVVTFGWWKFWSSKRIVSFFASLLNDYLQGFDPLADRVSHWGGDIYQFGPRLNRTAVLDFLKKGDPETWEKKMGSGGGIQSIKMQTHTNREIGRLGHYLFVVVRSDGSAESFCSWTCVNNLSSLLEGGGANGGAGGGSRPRNGGRAKSGAGGGSRPRNGGRAKSGAGGGSRPRPRNGGRAKSGAGGGSRPRNGGRAKSGAGGGSRRRSSRLRTLV